MRKVTESAAKAFQSVCAFRNSNTQVRCSDGEVVMYLHGNRIAYRKVDSSVLHVTCAGWNTVTTRERLNGLLSILSIPFFYRQKNYNCQLVDCKADLVFEDSDSQVFAIDLTTHKVTALY